MRVVDYKQTNNKDDAVFFINKMPDDCVYEITVHGKELDYSKLRPVKVYIDGELIYSIRAKDGSYWSKRLGEFYLSKSEGWQLFKYLENYAEGGATPHWWPYAEHNIQRHSDPLAELRDAMTQGFDISIKFGE